MFESGISAGAVEKLPEAQAPGNLGTLSLRGLTILEGRAKKCMERDCDLANKTIQQLHKVVTLCIDDHRFEEEMGSVGQMS